MYRNIRKRVVWIFFVFVFVLSIWVFFHESQATGEGGGHFFWLLYSTSTRFTDTLDISRVMTAESSPLHIVMTTGSSPLHIASSRTRTGNLWFQSASWWTLSYAPWDPFTVFGQVSFLSTYLLYTMFEYAFSLHVVLKFYFLKKIILGSIKSIK